MEVQGRRVRHASHRPRGGDPLLHARPGRLHDRSRPGHGRAARPSRQKAPGGPPGLSSQSGGVGLLRWAMNDADGVLLSVRAEARQLVAPDYAVLDGVFEHTAGSRAEAAGSVTANLDRLTAGLAALGGVPFDEATRRRPLTWSAYSSATREESYHDQETGRLERTGQVTATVALQVTVRDLGALGDLGGVLAAHPGLNVHGVTWHVDWDHPAWPQVRAAAIGAA